MYNNDIIITRMSRMIVKVNKRITVIIKYDNNNESHTTTNNTNNELRINSFSNIGDIVTSSSYIKHCFPPRSSCFSRTRWPSMTDTFFSKPDVVRC